MSEQQFVSKDAFEGRAKVVDERFGRDKERIDGHDVSLKMVETMTLQMGELLKRHDEKDREHDESLKTLDTRVTTIEKQPLETWSKMKLAIITALCGSLVTGVVGFVIWLVNNVPKP